MEVSEVYKVIFNWVFDLKYLFKVTWVKLKFNMEFTKEDCKFLSAGDYEGL